MIALSTFEPKRPSMTPGEAPRRSSKICSAATSSRAPRLERRVDGAFDDVGRGRRWRFGHGRVVGSVERHALDRDRGRLARDDLGLIRKRAARRRRDIPRRPSGNPPARIVLVVVDRRGPDDDAGVAQLLRGAAAPCPRDRRDNSAPASPRSDIAPLAHGLARAAGVRRGAAARRREHLARIGVDDHAPAELVVIDFDIAILSKLDAFGRPVRRRPDVFACRKNRACAPNDDKAGRERRKHDYPAQHSQTLSVQSVRHPGDATSLAATRPHTRQR